MDTRRSYKIISTGFFGSVIGIGLIIFAFQFDKDNENRTITLLVCTLGLILGWIVAIMTTPYNKKDGDSIDKFSKLVGTFLTGYILSKADKVIEKVFREDYILSIQIGGRLLFFLCFFGLSWIVVFVYRLYATGEMDKNNNTENTNK